MTIKEVTQDSEEESFLGTVTAVTDAVETNSSLKVDVHMNGQMLQFKVDTGADVTIISEKVYNKERNKELQPCSMPLTDRTDEALEVCGQITGHLARNDVECQQTNTLYQTFVEHC